MDATGAGTATWAARRLDPRPLPGAGRWGVVHVPTGQRVAFGSEARCRAVVAHLTEVDALLPRPGGAGAGAAPADSPAPADGPGGERTMRHPDEAPEYAGGGGTLWLLAAGLVVVISVALAVLVGAVAADELAGLEPGRLLATWAAR